MSPIICVLELQFEKNASISFYNVLLFPLPTQHNVENQKKLQVLVFNIVWGVGGEVRQVKRLYSRLACAQVPKVYICPKTFVHDCRYNRPMGEGQK